MFQVVAVFLTLIFCKVV